MSIGMLMATMAMTAQRKKDAKTKRTLVATMTVMAQGTSHEVDWSPVPESGWVWLARGFYLDPSNLPDWVRVVMGEVACQRYHHYQSVRKTLSECWIILPEDPHYDAVRASSGYGYENESGKRDDVILETMLPSVLEMIASEFPWEIIMTVGGVQLELTKEGEYQPVDGELELLLERVRSLLRQAKNAYQPRM